ncbi:MAG: N-acetylmuramoyl-L-alanine amidase [bacterium]|nr:N-acetylmuramoyl-L-alanine amidase [bacterium]
MIFRLFVVSLILLFSNLANAAPIRVWPSAPSGKPIDIVYPRETDSLGRVTLAAYIDSTFLLGNVANPLITKLAINGKPVTIDSGGGWIAWLKTPSRQHDFTWSLVAITGSDTNRLAIPVVRTGSPSIAPPIKLKSPFWALTKEGARFRNSPTGKNILLPMTNTPVKIQAKSRTNYFAKLPDGTGVWMDSAKIIRTKKQPATGVITKVSMQVDKQKRLTTVQLIGAIPTSFHYEYDEQNRKLTFRLQNAKVKPGLKIACLAGSLVEKIEFFENNKDVVVNVSIANQYKYLGYRWETDSLGLALTLREAPPPSAEPNRPLVGWRIVVDPGHGGVEYGSIGPTWFAEKTANLDVSNRLTKRLLELGAEVKQTRTTDTVMALTDRVAIAENWQADILLSVHHNALPDGNNPWDSTGTAVYFFHSHSEGLAKTLYKRLLVRLALPERGVYVGDFAICRSQPQLSVLTEAAFMIRPEQERKLRTEEFRQLEAEALAEGLVDFVQMSR